MDNISKVFKTTISADLFSNYNNWQENNTSLLIVTYIAVAAGKEREREREEEEEEEGFRL